MKQRITVEDLNMLSKTQRRNLRDLWKPQRYSIAVSSMCINAETDEYALVEFCVGGVKIHPSGEVTIKDLHIVDGFFRAPTEQEKETYEEPAVFSKADCLPLLTIGEMMDIMSEINFSRFHFYLLAGTGTVGCEVGNFNSDLKHNMLTNGYGKAELCDVLWAMIISRL